MKRLALLLALAVVAGCSAPSSSTFVPNNSLSNQTVKTGLGDLLTTTAFKAEATGAKTVTIRSIYVDGSINGKIQKGYLPANCKATDVRGIAKGCGIKATAPLVIKNLLVALFTGPKATGCDAAQGKFSGKVKAGAVVPVVLHWTGKC
jgi:hypothetical protein